MKLMIMGYGDHGKDEAARILCELLGVSYLGSSWAACEAYIFDSLKAPLGYNSAVECYEDRRRWRTLWGELMAAYNDRDRARLGRYVYSKADIYVGVRRIEEFQAIKAAGLFDISIWVDASARKPPEPAASCTVYPGLADIVLENNGTLADLRAECGRVASILKTVLSRSDKAAQLGVFSGGCLVYEGASRSAIFDCLAAFPDAIVEKL